MAVIDWVDDGSDFGNARGLDYVALDVKIRIAERFGVTVSVGELPADIAAEQPGRREAREAYYRDVPRDRPEAPFAAFTISFDGGSFSGEHADGNGHTSGYRSHYWADRIGPETVVFDCRTADEDRIVRYAVSGPMLNVGLPAGKVSTLRAVDIDPVMRQVADDYLAPFGGLRATGA